MKDMTVRYKDVLSFLIGFFIVHSAVVLMEGGNEEDLERLAKMVEKEKEEEEGELDAKSQGTLAGMIDTSVKTSSSSTKSTPTAGPKSPTLSKKVFDVLCY